MYRIYHNSRFITRFLVNVNQDIEEQILNIINNYNEYYLNNSSNHIIRKNCVIVKEQNEFEPMLKNNRLTILLFNNFLYKQELHKIIENLPYPRGLEVKIEYHDSNDDKKCINFYQNNIKLLVKDNDKQFARAIAKWLLISNKINVMCDAKYDNVIIMTTISSNKRLKLTKNERWGPLYTSPENNNEFKFSENCVIEVYPEFEWKDQLKTLTKYGCTFKINNDNCKFDSIGKYNIKLKYTLKNGDPCGEEQSLCKLSSFIQCNIEIPNYTIVENNSSWIYQGLSKFYLVILTVEKNGDSKHLIPINNIEEIDNILHEYLSTTKDQEIPEQTSTLPLPVPVPESEPEQDDMFRIQHYFATEVSLINN